MEDFSTRLIGHFGFQKAFKFKFFLKKAFCSESIGLVKETALSLMQSQVGCPIGGILSLIEVFIQHGDGDGVILCWPHYTVITICRCQLVVKSSRARS